jgi:uncharacterized damage-inducible protein DinB
LEYVIREDADKVNILDHLKEMFRHMYWADAQVWNAVLSTPDAEKNNRLRTQLFQIHTAQYAFGQVWLKKPLEIPEIDKFRSLEEMARWACKSQDLLEQFVKNVEGGDLDQPVELPWAHRLEEVFGKKPAASTLAETMIQVASHSSHHRGQVCTSIRESGGEPPLIDFIAWVWFDKPRAQWPAIDSE